MTKLRATRVLLAAAVALFWIAEARAEPIIGLPGLVSVTVWEDTRFVLTDSLNEVILPIADSRLSTRLAALDASSNDFASTVGEFYDFFFSNADGTVDPSGGFLTVEARYNPSFPSNGGNLSRVDLNFLGGGTEFANSVSSFVVLGPGNAGTVGNAVDGSLDTTTLLGNTDGSSGRLRLTVGFAATAVPEPGALALVTSGLIGLLSWRRTRRCPPAVGAAKPDWSKIAAAEELISATPCS